MRTVYFDYNATTPLDAAVRTAMLPFLDAEFGNPSSIHHVGRRARAFLDEARDRVARVFACKPSEMIFTSGGTESNNLAVFGVARHFRDKGRHIITSMVEHHALLHPCEYLSEKEGFEVTFLPVDRHGRVSPDDLRKALRPDTVLVSEMAANNEIGTLQPVAELGALCQERGVLFHTDAAQWFGKEPFADIHQFNADLVSVCAHKFHGPKGAGALFIRSPLLPDPILFGGGHENELRAGTENLPAIAGMTEAIERFERAPDFNREQLAPLATKLRDAAGSIAGVTIRSPREECLANTVSFSAKGCDSIMLLAGLDLEGICASSGSACSAGSLEPSHVLKAIGCEADESNALVRFSLGRESTAEEVQTVCAALPAVINRARGCEL